MFPEDQSSSDIYRKKAAEKESASSNAGVS